VRISLPDGRTTHLGYCYNVLPGETVEALIAQLHRFCGPVRRRVGVDRMGVGLWIARPAAHELVSDAAARHALREALDREQLYCFTLNGFPYGGFHAPRVKEQVFLPTWADPARVDYTIDLARILTELLPDDVDRGTISTVPLGPLDVDRAAALDGLRRAADALGDRIDLAIEPEPGAAFERVEDLAAWLATTGLDPRVGICLDCCHAAVVDEAAPAHLPIAKVQISSALVATEPDDRLASLAEPRFLHQVRCATGGAMDLPEALAHLDRSTPWRIHFHVPIHRDVMVGLATTRDSIEPALRRALAGPGMPPHLEVETYTWNVLPLEARPTDDVALVEGIAGELAWAAQLLEHMGATR
jgi:sugar phosphate isomerase/epimerase